MDPPTLNTDDFPTVGNRLELELLARQEPNKRIAIIDPDGVRWGPYHARCAATSPFVRAAMQEGTGAHDGTVSRTATCVRCHADVSEIEVDPHE